MSTSIVFVDSALTDYQSLVSSLSGDNQVILIDSQKDGLTQMLDAVAGQSDISAIHILGHGASGLVQLGTTILDNADLAQYQSQLAALGSHLSANADILLYGCNVAAGTTGMQFIANLAQATGADVAASTNLTGSAALGGDWVLELSAGPIDAVTLSSTDYGQLLSPDPFAGKWTFSSHDIFASGIGGTPYQINVETGLGYGNPDFPPTGAVTIRATWTDESDSSRLITTQDWTSAATGGQFHTFNLQPSAEDALALDGDFIEVTFTFSGPGTVSLLGPYTSGLTETYQYSLSNWAAPNSAPTAGTNGEISISAGASLSASYLTTANTGSSDPDSGDTLTYTLTGSTVVAPSDADRPSWKGRNLVGTQSYSVSDGHDHTANGTINVYATYRDDAAGWSTDPATADWNKSWSSSGTNTTTLNGATDPESDPISYAIVSVNGLPKPAWMSINGSTGAITANVAPEFQESTYQMIVSATSSGTSTPIQKAFTITTGTAAQLNDIPTASTGSKTVAEDAPAHLSFGTVDFNFADLDNSAGLSSATGAALARVRIESLTNNGTLSLNGDPVTVSQEILTADLSKLIYTPNTDYSGSESFTYSVSDGIDWSVEPTTMNITVTPSNDAPVLVDGVPTLTTIDENATTNPVSNPGNFVGDLISRTGGGTTVGTPDGITDVDTKNNGGLGNVPESVGMGIAIFAATHSNLFTIDGSDSAYYGTGGGHWQYSTNNGQNWSEIGVVNNNGSLLLSVTDKVRFIPDAINGTIGTLNYYLWDGANGTSHGTYVDVNDANRGGSTPYSLTSDTATLMVGNVNDAPLLDLDGNNSSGATGTGTTSNSASYKTEYLVRSLPVPVVDTDITISDIDSLQGADNVTKFDTIDHATVAITAGAIDNLFGTTYETLNTLTATVIGSLGTITVTGSASASISIAGTGTWEEYQTIIKSITYQNANPNAYPGDRTVTVSITDSAITDSLHPATVSATTTITNVWAPYVDTNGVAEGVSYSTSFTEGNSPIKIVSADATITDEDSHLKKVVVSIYNRLNGDSEVLAIPGGDTTNWNGIDGLTVSGSGTGTITLTGDLAPNFYQLALRSITYSNSSDAPNTTQRDITVVATDIQDHVGVTGHSYIGLTAVNDAPVLGAAGSGSPQFLSDFFDIAEDVLNGENRGNTVASLIADGRITDPDLTGTAPEAIAVSAVDNTNGIWQYKLGNGSWTTINFAANSGKALLLDSTDSLRFVPNADWNGTVSNGITFYAWDKTSAAAGDYLTVNGNTGGDKVLSTATGTVDITVNAVNDAPVMTGSGSNMTGITEDDTSNAGQTVASVLATVTDIDSINLGVAIYGTTVIGPTTGGKWQYNVNSTGWTDFGSVAVGSALLLKSTDLVRFEPDTKNGQTASFDYYAWDQYSGTAGSKVDVNNRGGSTPYSTASDSVSITVADLNDAPVVSTGYSTNFLVRSGRGVAIVNVDTFSITDVDKTSGGITDTIATATVKIKNGAIDNNFGTIYETLTLVDGTPVVGTPGSYTVAGTLDTLTISGSNSPSITITGIGTLEEYQNLITEITYQNANPNAYTGDRTVEINITDSAITGGVSSTVSAVSTIHNIWAPVVDTNGVQSGVTYTTSYTEGGEPAKVVTADATITDEDSHLKSVVVTIRDADNSVVANAYETLSISNDYSANLNGLGLTVTGSGTNTITLTGNLPPSIYQLALRSITYANSSTNPGDVTRHISVVATDTTDQVGYTGVTNLTVIPVNSPPTLVDVLSGSIAENNLATTTTDLHLSGTLSGNDVESGSASLVYGITGGTAGVEPGTIVKSGTYGTLLVYTAGGAYTYSKKSDVIEQLAANASVSDEFSVTVSDGSLSTSKVFTVNVTGGNDAPVASGSYTHAIFDTAAADTFSNLTGTLTATDVDAPDTLTWSGNSHGTYGDLTVNSNGSYSYVVTADAVNALNTSQNVSDTFTATVTDSQGATATRTISVNVTGVNDTPVASGAYTHSIVDTASVDSYNNLTGQLHATDPDANDSLTWSGSSTGSYGTLTVNSNGSYSYIVAAAAVNAVPANQSATDTFTATVTDSHGASATRTITVNVTGANDPPVATGTYTHTITDTAAADTFADLTGTLTATDVDVPDTLTWSGSSTGSYGALTVSSDGSYRYVVNAAAVNALPATTATETFTATVTDSHNATATRTISVNVTGVNDRPVVTNEAAQAVGTVTEAGLAVVGTDHTSGLLLANDVDTNATYSWSVYGTPSTTYGAFSLNSSTGAWDYTLNNNLAATQALKADQMVDQTYTARVTDQFGAYADETVTVHINGTNDAPTISGVPDTAPIFTAGTAEALADFTIADAETGTLSVSLVASSGTIGGITDSDPLTAGIQLSGTASAINSALANATFTITNALDPHFSILVTDDKNATASATYHMIADNAGVLTTIESGVPSLPSAGGGTAGTGDGNGDGVADSQQLSVLSVPLLSTSTPTINTGADHSYITMVADSNAGVIDTTNAGTAVVTDIHQLDKPSTLPAGMQMPLGELAFIATTIDTGVISQTFSLFVDSSLGANGYWTQNSAGVWQNLATHIETVDGKTRIDFTIADGGAFDTDHAAGTISNQGALGSKPLSIVSAVPVTTPGGFFF